MVAHTWSVEEQPSLDALREVVGKGGMMGTEEVLHDTSVERLRRCAPRGRGVGGGMPSPRLVMLEGSSTRSMTYITPDNHRQRHSSHWSAAARREQRTALGEGGCVMQ